MDMKIQNWKWLLSGIFAGSAFFCACTQDIVADNFPVTPRNSTKYIPSAADQKKLETLSDFGKAFSLRLIQPGKASAADLATMFRLLEKDPYSMQLNVMLQNIISKSPPAVRVPAEKKYIQIAERFPKAFVMQTFAAELLLRNKETQQKGIGQLFHVFQEVLQHKTEIPALSRKDVVIFRQNLLRRLLLLTFVHKKEMEYNVICNFLRKNPQFRQIDLLTDWLLTSSGVHESAEPMPLLPGGVVPGKALYALQDFYRCKQEILQNISRGELPEASRCKILLNIFVRYKSKPELEQALQQYLKVTDRKKHQLAYVMLGDMVNGVTKQTVAKKVFYYRKALDAGLPVYDQRVLHLAGMYLDLNDLTNAEKILQLISKKAPRVNTTFHYIALYNARKDYKSALKKIKEIREPFFRYQQEAFTYSMMEEHRKALSAADKAWQAAWKKNRNFRNRTFLYFTAILADKCGDMKKLKAYLEPEIRRNPKDMDLKNTLAYILADHNTDLEQAYSLLKEVVTVKPHNGAYLDSMAWVLYRMKRYPEAKKYILSALAHQKEKGRVMLDHAGDIFYALKEYEAAASYWHQALRAKGEVKKEIILDKLKRLKMKDGVKK